MVFCGLYPIDGDEYGTLRESLEKLGLNDASFTYQAETSGALGFGFRCGFLGLLHMEIVRERLEREFGLSLIATAPSVEYQVQLTTGDEIEIDNPSEMPSSAEVSQISEPPPAGHHHQSRRVHRCPHGPVPEPPGRAGDDEYLSPERLEMSTGCPSPRWSWTSSTS